MKKFLPNKRQWKSWSLPSKLTAIGTCIAVLSIPSIILSYFSYTEWFYSKIDQIIPKKQVNIVTAVDNFVNKEHSCLEYKNFYFKIRDDFVLKNIFHEEVKDKTISCTGYLDDMKKYDKDSFMLFFKMSDYSHEMHYRFPIEKKADSKVSLFRKGDKIQVNGVIEIFSDNFIEIKPVKIKFIFQDENNKISAGSVTDLIDQETANIIGLSECIVGIFDFVYSAKINKITNKEYTYTDTERKLSLNNTSVINIAMNAEFKSLNIFTEKVIKKQK